MAGEFLQWLVFSLLVSSLASFSLSLADTSRLFASSQASSSNGFQHVIPGNNSTQPSLNITDRSPKRETSRLERVLKDAAMEDNSVILTALNDPRAVPGSNFDLFLESFKIGDGFSVLLNHLVIIALDQKAYERCMAVHGRCFALVTEGVDFSQQAVYMSSEYLKMLWRRTDFLRTVVEFGYNFVFKHTDIMWFRNPFPRFYKDADFQIASDNFNGDPDNTRNMPNVGYEFVKSNNKSIQF